VLKRLTLLLASALAVPAAAQFLPPAPTATPVASATSAPVAEASPDSPRSALFEYFQLCRRGRYGDAARYLDLPPGREGEGPALARKLKHVLDQKLWVDLEAISPLPGGSLDDGLPSETEQIGTIPGPSGRADAVRLVRRKQAEGPEWLFARSTVLRVPGWYALLEGRWLLDHLPDPLMRPGPKELLWAQWIVLLGLLIPAGLLGRLLGWLSQKALLLVARRTPARWDEVLVNRLLGPFALAWTLTLLSFGSSYLGLYPPAERFFSQLMKAGLIALVFWTLIRIVAGSGEVAARSQWALTNPAAHSILVLWVRMGEVVVIILGALAAGSAAGLPINSLLAGVGIGGLGIALAAQKTLENVFGSISIGVDQPFHVGDTVRVGDISGTVETLGLRSTRIRTLERTVVTIPNGKLADREIETFGVRDRSRLSTVICVVYGTTAAQIREIVSGIEAVLKAHPKFSPDPVFVRFLGFGESSLNIEVMAWFETNDFGEIRNIRQDVYLAIMEVVERAGSSFAYPTRTLYLAKDLPPGTLPAPDKVS